MDLLTDRYDSNEGNVTYRNRSEPLHLSSEGSLSDVFCMTRVIYGCMTYVILWSYGYYNECFMVRGVVIRISLTH